MPELALAVSATTRDARPGEEDGVDYHFLSDDEFERRVQAGEFVEHARYSGRRYGTLREELERHRAAGRPVLLEIEVQGARQVREAMPEAVQVFIEPPSEDALRTRLVGRGTDSADQVEARLDTAREELARAGRVRARRRQRPARGRGGRAGGARARAGCRTDARLSQPPNRGPNLISPRVDKLLDNVDSPYASVIVAAKRARQINSYYHNLGEGTFEEFPPPMIDTGSKNYLTIALEEVAGGKIKYRYRG